MNKAREIILRLLSEGKITIEEAEELLDAMPNEKIGRTRFARTPKNVEIPIVEKEPKHGFKFDFHFPWDDPNWKWPWEEEGWRWPWESSAEEDEGKESSFFVEENSSLSIKCGDGNLSISMTDDESVHINSDEEEIKSVLSDGNKTLYLNLGDANAEITVPRRISALRVSKNDGDISIADLQSNIDLKSDDGNVAITRVNGNINVSMDDGNLMIRDADSEAVVLKCDDVNILLDNITTKNVTVKMSDGMFSMDTAVAITEGSFNITADDGRISLSLPSDSRFKIVANVEDGIIRHNLKDDLDKRFVSADVQHTENDDGSSLIATINGGGAEFSLSLDTGEIDIQVQ